jgi:O-antigen/teichoic acid export membrane protein
MLVAGPQVMDLLFGGDFDYERGGLLLVALGMGLYLSAATLNQALLAHGRAQQSCLAWVGCAVAFALFLLLVDVDDPVLQVEAAFVGAAAALCTLLWLLYRRA